MMLLLRALVILGAVLAVISCTPELTGPQSDEAVIIMGTSELGICGVNPSFSRQVTPDAPSDSIAPSGAGFCR